MDTTRPDPADGTDAGAAAAHHAREREFDLVVFGATGFTGALVAEHLARTAGRIDARADGRPGRTLRWALAGRDRERLAAVRERVGAPQALQLLVADADDADALRRLVGRTRAIITTVGPYQRHGETLVRTCAEAGTDYLDLCGEPAWMARMIPVLEPLARASGARIVFSCGFDSIPFDLGVLVLQDEAVRRFGAPLTEVHGRVRTMRGGPSGGTVASLLATVEAMQADPAVGHTMADPFALTPGFEGPPQPGGDQAAAYDAWVASWTAPFMMAPINTKNVHRTNFLRGHPWGRQFRYDERQMTGDGEPGRRRAMRQAWGASLQQRLLGWAPARALLSRVVLPRPGQGPDATARERGRYEVWFVGRGPQEQPLRVVVRGDRDPGYGSTSKIVAEAARCLLDEVTPEMAGGGVWTPGAAMGLALARRLQAHAGLSFSVEPDVDAT